MALEEKLLGFLCIGIWMSQNKQHFAVFRHNRNMGKKVNKKYGQPPPPPIAKKKDTYHLYLFERNRDKRNISLLPSFVLEKYWGNSVCVCVGVGGGGW